jgi:hypothetical protein
MPSTFFFGSAGAFELDCAVESQGGFTVVGVFSRTPAIGQEHLDELAALLAVDEVAEVVYGSALPSNAREDEGGFLEFLFGRGRLDGLGVGNYGKGEGKKENGKRLSE